MSKCKKPSTNSVLGMRKVLISSSLFHGELFVNDITTEGEELVCQLMIEYGDIKLKKSCDVTNAVPLFHKEAFFANKHQRGY